METVILAFSYCLSMYDCCIDTPILSIDRVVHKKLMFTQLSLAWLCQTRCIRSCRKSNSSITELFASARELQNATD